MSFTWNFPWSEICLLKKREWERRTGLLCWCVERSSKTGCPLMSIRFGEKKVTDNLSRSFQQRHGSETSETRVSWEEQWESVDGGRHQFTHLVRMTGASRRLGLEGLRNNQNFRFILDCWPWTDLNVNGGLVARKNLMM